MANLHAPSSRRWLFLPLMVFVLLTAAIPAPKANHLPDNSTNPQLIQAAGIMTIALNAMNRDGLKAVIVRVTVDGQEIVTEGLGESMTGVPATKDMHFRNGAVAISYMAMILLQLVDQGVVGLDDPLSRWMPELPDSDRVTLRMLINMTAGYPDYVPDEGFTQAYYEDPFHQYTPEDLIAIGLVQPRLFAPGTNWDYSHTNIVILGRALERLTGKPMDTLMQQYVLGPLNLRNTVGSSTAAIPSPVLHAYTSERRPALGIPAGISFLEDSTYWNPSWTLAEGSIQTTNIYDMEASAVAIGKGTLLSSASYQAMVGPNLVGVGAPLAGCRSCRMNTTSGNFGLGVINRGPWIMQTPSFGGYSAIEAYLPSKKIAIAITATYTEAAFDENGNYKNGNSTVAMFNEIARYLAPNEVPG